MIDLTPGNSQPCRFAECILPRTKQWEAVILNFMPKYLLVFEKGEAVRWLGHLDILRTFERAIRRAQLPVAFTQGFNPREKLAFASALSTGVTGCAELATIELTAPLSPEQICNDLNATLPVGIRLRECRELTDSEEREVVSAYAYAEYDVVCACSPHTTVQTIQDGIAAILAQPELMIEREREGRTRPINIRPALHALALLPDSLCEERLTLRMLVGQGEAGTARPAEVVAVLSRVVPGVSLRRSCRVRLVHKETISRKP